MTEDQLTLEVALVLREMGFPQGNWPQMVARVAGPFIRREDGSLDDSRRRTVYEYWQGPERALAGNLMEYVAAPDPLTALRYCTGLGYSIAIAVHVHGDHYDRFAIYERDNWICQLCKKPVNRNLKAPHRDSATLDHIVPLNRGGEHTPANVQLAHWGCNSGKKDMVKVAQLRLIG